MPRSRHPSRRALETQAQAEAEAEAEAPTQTPTEEEPTNANTASDDEAVGSEESAPAQARTQAGRRAGSYAWTVPAHLFLIGQLKAAIREGERAEAGFHKRVWDRIAQRFPSEGLAPVTKQQLKNKVDAVCPWVILYRVLLTSRAVEG
jgi:Myb/SANT-like DNA-binding domain